MKKLHTIQALERCEKKYHDHKKPEFHELVNSIVFLLAQHKKKTDFDDAFRYAQFILGNKAYQWKGIKKMISYDEKQEDPEIKSSDDVYNKSTKDLK